MEFPAARQAAGVQNPPPLDAVIPSNPVHSTRYPGRIPTTEPTRGFLTLAAKPTADESQPRIPSTHMPPPSVERSRSEYRGDPTRMRETDEPVFLLLQAGPQA
ncbi:hypothetical protein B7017_1874 [Bifidobacterium breve JCM 7017]|nr:hypothetical protein B7017_1874 [Bifidobacterium breve JCM 7017]